MSWRSVMRWNATATESVVAPKLPWWLLTAYAGMSAIGTLPLLVKDHSRPMEVRAVAGVVVVLVVLGWALESRGYRSRWVVVTLEALAVLMVSVALSVPDRAKGLLFAAVSRRGVCSSSRTTIAIAVAADSAMFVAGVIVHHTLSDIATPSFMESVFSLPGLAVAAITMRMLLEGLAARAAAEQATARTSAALRAVVDTSPVGLMLLDSHGAVQLCNRNAEQMLGCPTSGASEGHEHGGSDPEGPGCTSLIPQGALEGGQPLVDHEINGFARGDGTVVDLTISTAAVPGADQVVAVVCDVTERRRMQEQLRTQALHDGLTGLANRTLFLDKTEAALASAAADGDSTTVLLLDLDAFKTVNDTRGHAAGDLLLVEVAERLLGCLRQEDTLARLGGDEFAILLQASGESEALVVAERVLSAFDQPVRLISAEDATIEVRVRVSLGAVVADGLAETDASALLRAADMAMYAAKRAGGHRCAVYEPTMQRRLRERVALEEALRAAVVDDGLRLHYQPCVDLVTNEVSGAEALLRWNDPGRGAIPPRQFIPIAEDTGMIVEIGRWALLEACRQASAWQPLCEHPMVVAVNLSVRQLNDPGLPGDIAMALGTSGLSADCLVLELTESELADDTVLPVLCRLKDLGVRLALDDFGTGYSSLAYLRRFPLDILKIDRAFVTPITHDSSAAALTRSIIDMAHTLGLDTVAEGVETVEQAEMLRTMECNSAQGFLFAQPQPPEDMTAALNLRARAAAARRASAR